MYHKPYLQQKVLTAVHFSIRFIHLNAVCTLYYPSRIWWSTKFGFH